VTAISDVMIAYSGPIQLLGGVLLRHRLAVHAAHAVDHASAKIPPHRHHWGIIPQTFFLSISNPGTILGMLALIGGLGSLIGSRYLS